MTSDGDRAWFRSRLTAFAAGILEADEEQRFESLLDDSEECRDQLELFLALEPSGGSTGEHIPRSMIEAWTRVAPALSGLMRELVDDHLERCDSCRRALAARGHEVALAGRPGTIPESGSVREQRVGSVTFVDRLRGWRFRLAATWAVAATAAAMVLILAPGGVDGPARSPSAALPLALIGSQRQGGVPVVRVPAATHALSIVLEPPWELQKTEDVIAELLDPEGNAVASARGSVASMVRPRGVLVFELAEPFTAGRYVLRLSSIDRPDVAAERALDVFLLNPSP